MKNMMAILSLMTISFTVHAESFRADTARSAAEIKFELEVARADRTQSRLYAEKYYTSKLDLCVFKQNIKNSMAENKQAIDLSDCSGVITQALERGDLDENEIRQIIDSLVIRQNEVQKRNAARAVNKNLIKSQTQSLVDYGNQKFKQ